ncbi:MAG: hypothetical protein ACP5P4_05225 [Steroidobacteraceae bacterium]
MNAAQRISRYSGAGTAFDYPEAIGFNRQPFASVCVGDWTCCAGPAGTAVGCFGWLDAESGQVTNYYYEPVTNNGALVYDASGQLTFSTNPIPGAILVFVLPVANDYNLWERAYISYPVNGVPPFSQEVVRPYVRCGAAVAGVFSPKFPNGGQVGTQVYANPYTGLPYSGDTAGTLIATPYTLLQNGAPNGRLRMSSYVNPFN